MRVGVKYNARRVTHGTDGTSRFALKQVVQKSN
jgi:hypothetical protein